VPDERLKIEAAIKRMAKQAQLVVTTGGTGVAPRDVTPEATRAVCDRLVDGIAERMRAEGSKKTPLAALSRGACGIRGRSLVLNLPGSPTGATESLAAVVGLLPHALELLQGKTAHAESRR
jgi:molybdenum cofactor synthesis domain-containing protein